MAHMNAHIYREYSIRKSGNRWQVWLPNCSCATVHPWAYYSLKEAKAAVDSIEGGK